MTSVGVLALDPGGTTGWALAGWKDHLAPTLFSHGQLGPDEHHHALRVKLLDMGFAYERVHIVYESFEFRQHAQASRHNINLMSKEYIGVIKEFKQMCDATALGILEGVHSQTAAQGKGFVGDDKLKKLELWDWRQKHAMDAYRHLIYFLVNHDPTRPGEVSRSREILKRLR